MATKKVKMSKAPSVNALKLRKASGLTQQQFWNAVGITQSGGSRYERGRRLPSTVRSCLLIAYSPLLKAMDEYHRLRNE